MRQPGCCCSRQSHRRPAEFEAGLLQVHRFGPWRRVNLSIGVGCIWRATLRMCGSPSIVWAWVRVSFSGTHAPRPYSSFATGTTPNSRSWSGRSTNSGTTTPAPKRGIFWGRSRQRPQKITVVRWQRWRKSFRRTGRVRLFARSASLRIVGEGPGHAVTLRGFIGNPTHRKGLFGNRGSAPRSWLWEDGQNAGRHPRSRGQITRPRSWTRNV